MLKSVLLLLALPAHGGRPGVGSLCERQHDQSLELRVPLPRPAGQPAVGLPRAGAPAAVPGYDGLAAGRPPT